MAVLDRRRAPSTLSRQVPGASAVAPGTCLVHVAGPGVGVCEERCQTPPVTTTAPASGEPVRGRLVTRPFLLVTLATFAYFTALGMQLPTIPTYVRDELGGGGLEVGLASGFFAVSAAIIRPFAGRLGDRRGRRILVMGGAGVLGLSMLGYTFASTLAILLVLRLVSGVGEAAMFVGAATATQDLAPPDRRAEAASYYSVALYAGLAVGPIVGEKLVDGPGYDALWFTSGGCALVAAFLGSFTPVGEVHPDARPGRLLHPAALAPGLVLLLGLVPFIGFATFLKLYGESIGTDSVGPIFGVYAITVLVIRLAGARIPDRLGWRRSGTIALTSLVIASALLAAWADPIALWLSVLPFSIGMSLLFPALFATVVDRVPESERSQAIGTFSVFFDLANGIGAPFLGAFVAIANERTAFGVGAVVAATGFVALRRAVAAAEPDHIDMHIAEPG